jgi:CDP-diacylglycerol--serine O-phosphatidyltransferase
VSFGVLPGLILVLLVFKTNSNWATAFYFLNAPWLGLLGFLMPMAAAYRLARFTRDNDQQTHFKGLPAPSAGLLIGALPLILEHDLLVIGYRSIYLAPYILDPWLLLGIMLVIPALMVSKVTFFNLKFSHYGWKGNELKWLFIALSVILGVLLFYAAIPLVILLYILVSLMTKNT